MLTMVKIRFVTYVRYVDHCDIKIVVATYNCIGLNDIVDSCKWDCK